MDLSRWGGGEPVDFRLPSLSTNLNARDRKRIADAEALAVAIAYSRGRIQDARQQVAGHAIMTTINWQAIITRHAEGAAADCPEERGRIDAITAMGNAGLLSLLTETLR